MKTKVKKIVKKIKKEIGKKVKSNGKVVEISEMKMTTSEKHIVGTVYNKMNSMMNDVDTTFKGLNINKNDWNNKDFPLMRSLDTEANVRGMISGNNEDVTVVVIGKGVIFDTGGFDLKTKMYSMHGDKAGSIATLSLSQKIQNKKVAFLAGFVINKPTIFPGTIVKTVSGKAVEIINTDAEGRLVLADLIEFAQRSFPNLKHIVTIATLTGHKRQVLGDEYAALHTNHKGLRTKAFDNADDIKLFPMPNFPEVKIAKSKRIGVDIPNIDVKCNLGSTTAYRFLQYFVNDDIMIHHVDMAGNELDKDVNPTGYGVEQLNFIINNIEGK